MEGGLANPFEAPKSTMAKVYDWREDTIRQQQRKFKSEHYEILTKYGSDLPEPNKNVKIITVVPAYRELANDNLWRLLESVIAQPGDEFEILYIVNNTSEAVDADNAAFQENQRTIKLLKVLNNKARDSSAHNDTDTELSDLDADLEHLGLSAQKKKIFKKAFSRGIGFHVIDASSPNYALNNQGSPQGQARNIGSHIAYERLREATGQKGEGIIDYIDADCTLSPGYYRKLLKAHAESQDQILVKSLHAIVPDISEQVEKESDPLMQLVGLIQYLKIAQLQGRAHYLLNLQPTGEELEQTGHGPAFAIQADLLKTIGGYPSEWGSEDFIFYDLLKSKVKPENFKKTNIRLNLSQRSREDSFDGAEIGVLKLDKNEDAIKYLTHFSKENFANISEDPRVFALQQEIRNYLDKMFARDQEYQQDPEYLKIRSQEFRKENYIRKQFAQKAKHVIKTIVDAIQSDAGNKGDQFERITNSLPEEDRDFLLANTSLLEAINTIILLKESDNPNRIIEFFNDYLPEYFEITPNEEPDYNTMRGLLKEKSQILPFNWRNALHLAATIRKYENLKQQTQHSDTALN